ncbi:hypothetical protein DM02DRAFT_547744, partial [Periconia macrospinosa]
VALKRFIDDITVEAIETDIIAHLDTLISPIDMAYLPTDVVTNIAGESDNSRVRREQLTHQLDVLVKGSEICKSFMLKKLQGKFSFTPFNPLLRVDILVLGQA